MAEQTVGSLLLELGLSEEAFDKSWAEFESNAIASAKKLESKLNSKLMPSVNGSQLTDLEKQLHGLNKLWDKKHQHFSQPLKPKVDPSDLNAMEAQLDRISKKQLLVAKQQKQTRLVNPVNSPSTKSGSNSIDTSKIETKLTTIGKTLIDIKKNTKDTPLSDVFRGAREGLGAELGRSFRKRTSKSISNTATNLANNPDIQNFGKLATESFLKNVRKAQYHIADAVVAGLEEKNVADVLFDKQRIKSNLGDIKNDFINIAEEFNKTLGRVDFSQAPPQKAFDNALRNYRKAGIKERAVPLVQQRSQEILESGKLNKKINDSIDQLVLTIGGWANKGGRTGPLYAREFNKDAREGQLFVGLKNPDQDRVNIKNSDDELKGSKKLLNNFEILAKTNIRGFSFDAIEGAAQAISALEKNPELEIKIIAESGGGYVAQEISEILRSFGVKSNYLGAGTPQTLGELGTPGGKLILSEDEWLGQDVAQQYRPKGLSKKNPQQSLMGPDEHSIFSYLESGLAEIDEFFNGQIEAFSKSEAEDIRKLAESFSPTLGAPGANNIPAEVMQNISEQAWGYLQETRQALFVATSDTVDDLKKAESIFEKIYLQYSPEDELLSSYRQQVQAAEGILRNAQSNPGIESGAKAQKALKGVVELEREIKDYLATGFDDDLLEEIDAPEVGTRARKANVLHADVMRIKKALDDPKLFVRLSEMVDEHVDVIEEINNIPQPPKSGDIQANIIPDPWEEPAMAIAKGGETIEDEFSKIAEKMAGFETSANKFTETIEKLNKSFYGLNLSIQKIIANAKGLAIANPKAAAKQLNIGKQLELDLSNAQKSQLSRARNDLARQQTVAQSTPAPTDPREAILALKRQFQAQRKAYKQPGIDPQQQAVLARGLGESIPKARELASQIKGLVSGDKALNKAIADLRNTLTQNEKIAAQIVQDFTAAGGQVPHGMAAGIAQSMGDLEAVAIELANTVIDAAEDELEIQSPSKVFEQIGKYVVDGFENGMDGVKKLANNSPFGTFIDDIKSKVDNGQNVFEGLIKNVFALGKAFLAFKSVELITNSLDALYDVSLSTAIEFESLSNSIRFSIGNFSDAGNQIERLTNQSNDLGISVRENIGNFSRLAAATKGTSLQGFQTELIGDAFSEAVAASNLTNDKVANASVAIAQIAQKGIVSQEELRGQLSEVSGVFGSSQNIAARAFGLDSKAFQKKISKGITSEEFLPKFATALSAESFLGIKTDSMQGKLNKLDNAVVALQNKVGSGILPVEKLKTDVITNSINFLTDNIGMLLKGATFLTLMLSKGLVVSLFNVAKGTITAAVANVSLSGSFVKAAAGARLMLKSLGSIALQFAVFQGIIDLFSIFSAAFKDPAEEMNKLADGVETGFSKITEAIDEARGSLKALGDELPEALNQVKGESLLENSLIGSLFPKEGLRAAEQSIQRLLGLTTQAQRAATDQQIAIDRTLTASNQNQGAALSQLGIDGPAGELSKLVKIDRKLKSLNQERRTLAPESSNERKELESQISELQKQRQSPGKAIAVIQSQLARDEQALQQIIKQLNQSRDAGSITQQTYERQRTAAENSLESTQDIIQKLNSSISTTVDIVGQLSRNFERINGDLRDFNTQSELLNAQGRNRILRSQLGGATPGQVESLNASQSDDEFNRQLANNARAINQLSSLLESSEIQDVLASANLTGAGIAAIQERSSSIGEGREQDLLNIAAEASQQRDQLTLESTNIKNRILENQNSFRESLKAFGKSVNEFYRNIIDANKDLAAESLQLANQLQITSIANDIRESFLGFSRGFLSNFGEQFTSLIENLNNATQIDLRADQQIAQALRGLSQTGREANELNRQNPGRGVNGSQAGGQERLLALVGNSGDSTGSHLDIRVRGGGRRLTEQELGMFNAGGIPLNQRSQDITSEFGNRVHPIHGGIRHHGGIDFGLPSGTPITTSANILSMNVRPPSQTQGGGWTTDVILHGLEELEVSILHQIPEIQSRIGETIGSAISTPAPTSGSRSPSQPSMDQRVKAFLDTIAYAEGADYDTQFGGGTFDNGFARHPDEVISASGHHSSAAGRYQFITPTWDELAQRLNLPDFSPEAQDQAGIQLLKDSGAYDLLQQGNLRGAIASASPVWASLPNSRGVSEYDQPAKGFDELERIFNQSLGSQAVRIPGDRGGVSLSGARDNADLSISNINIQRQIDLANNSFQTQQQLEQITTGFEDSLRSLSDSITTQARSFEDLERAADIQSPRAELESQLVNLNRQQEDSVKELNDFIRQLEDTGAQAQTGIEQVENAIATSGLPIEVGNRMLESLQTASQRSMEALSESQARATEIEALYESQRQRLISEFERAERGRTLESQQRVLSREQELGNLEVQRLNRGGNIEDARKLEFFLREIEEKLNFDQAILALEDLAAAGTITADELSRLTMAERELSEARAETLKIEERLAEREQRRLERSEIYGSERSLAEGIANRRDQLGVGSDRIRRDLGEAEIQQNLSDELFRIEGLPISVEMAQKLRDTAIELSQISLANLDYSFSTWNSILPSIQSSTSTLFSSLITGSTSVAGAMETFFGSISTALSDLAAQAITSGIFSLILGAVGGGGIGSILGGAGAGSGLGNIFSMGGSKLIKGGSFSNGGWIRRGSGAIDDVLIMAKKGEYIASPEMAKMLSAQGLIPSYSTGGWAGRSANPIMPMMNTTFANSNSANNVANVSVTVNNNGGESNVRSQSDAGKFGKVLEAKIKGVIADEMRPRGMLANRR